MTAKVIDKINELSEEKKKFYSFEYFPPKTEVGVSKLQGKLKDMSNFDLKSSNLHPHPLFMDVTWGAGGSTSDLTLKISSDIQAKWGVAQMHLTCTNMPIEKVQVALEEAKKAGIRNIVALRGDPPKGAEKWEAIEGGFSYATDLVRYIRKNYGDYFGIAVAGYPEGHPESSGVDEDVMHLKEKINAGADYAITQLFYDVDAFFEWVKKCRKAGITCPLIPGIMPILTYGGFKRMTAFCKTNIPKEIEDTLNSIKDDEKKVKEYGIEVAIKMCNKLIAGGVPGLHFYTMNEDYSSKKILDGLDWNATTNILPSKMSLLLLVSAAIVVVAFVSKSWRLI